MYKKNIIKLLSALTLALAAGSSLASGITRDIRSSANVEDARQDGGYFELGAVFNARDTIIFKGNEDENKYGFGAIVNVGYQWKGLFVDVNEDEGVVFGYNAFNTDHWSYDIVSSRLGGINSDTSDRFASLRKREGTNSVGIRATGFYDKNIFQFELKDTQSNNFDGVFASALAGTSWQYRNLNTHVVAGLHYSSAGLNDYYWGVRPDESNAEFAQYTAGASTTFSSEIGITYPISENWIFKSKLNYVYGSEEIANSPLRADDSRHFLSSSASLIYVF
jgi:outer membrane protein